MYKTWLTKLFIFTTLGLVASSLLYKLIVVNPVYGNVTIKVQSPRVFVGASHFEVGINPELMPGVENLAISGEALYYTYHKLRNVLASNTNIQHIYLSYSPVHVSPFGDSSLLNDTGLSREYAFTYYPILDKSAPLYYSNGSVDYLTAKFKYDYGLPFGFLEDIKPWLNRNSAELPTLLNIIGEFKPVSGNHVNAQELQEKYQQYFADLGYEYSEVAIKSVDAIVALAEEHDIQITLVCMPIHPEFYAMIPTQYKMRYETEVNKLLSRHPALEFLDLRSWPMPAENFYDGDHLNPAGVQAIVPAFAN